MTRHAIAGSEPILDSVIHEAGSGPVELIRDGKAVAVVLSMADYERLRNATPRLDFWEASQRFREQTDLAELDIDGALAGVRDRSPGREVKL